MFELQRLGPDHEPAVLAFEQKNRAYLAEFISDRGDDFFAQFAERYSALLAEQEAGDCVFYVLVDEEENVVGRFNLYDLVDGTARVGYRVANESLVVESRLPHYRTSAGSPASSMGCGHSRRRLAMRPAKTGRPSCASAQPRPGRP